MAEPTRDPRIPPKTGKTPETPKTIDEQLDEALADSFPASDPVSFVTSQTEEDWGQDSPSPEDPERVAGKPKGKTTEP
jgi:hypothetical protein